MHLINRNILILALFLQVKSFAQNSPMDKKPFESDAVQAPVAEKKGVFETTYAPGRIIYLNGENISSIREQELENVNVRIDKNGNLYIEAPQYEVNAERSYHPLLPKELPKFKKENIYEKLPIPQGIYSKQTDKVEINELKEKNNSIDPVK